MMGENLGRIFCAESRPTILRSKIPSRLSRPIKAYIARRMEDQVSPRSRQLQIPLHARSSPRQVSSLSELWVIQCSLERPTGWQRLSIILKLRLVPNGEYYVPTNKSEHPVLPTLIPIPLHQTLSW